MSAHDAIACIASGGINSQHAGIRSIVGHLLGYHLLGYHPAVEWLRLLCVADFCQHACDET
jgi:hypothetical protein